MANVPISNLTTTWNNVSTTFTGVKLNVTDTASAAGSLLADFQVGGVSRARIGKDSVFTSNDPTSSGSSLCGFRLSSASYTGKHGLFSRYAASSEGWILMSAGVGQVAGAVNWPGPFVNQNLGFSSGNTAGSNPDTFLERDAANTLALRNGVNAQTQRIYGTFTDVSNYRRLTKTMSAGGVAEIKPEGAGTGASGNVLHISGLPTANPGPGILWNDAGTVKVGT